MGKLTDEAFAALSSDENAAMLLKQMGDFEKALQSPTDSDQMSQHLLREADRLETFIQKLTAVKTPSFRRVGQKADKAVRELTENILPTESVMARELEMWVEKE